MEETQVRRIISFALFHSNQATEDETQYMQTLDEILFTNVDVSANVISTLLKNLAATPTAQDGLRSEIEVWKRQPDFDVAKLVAKPETLLNRIVMESMRLSPAFCACQNNYNDVSLLTNH